MLSLHRELTPSPLTISTAPSPDNIGSPQMMGSPPAEVIYYGIAQYEINRGKVRTVFHHVTNPC